MPEPRGIAFVFGRRVTVTLLLDGSRREERRLARADTS